MKIASYNVLANSYIKPDRYPKVPPQFLQWDHRRLALLDKIDTFDAQVICLQEVEEETYQLIHALLTPKGYTGVYARKGQGRPDGCATFSLLPIHQWETIHYHDEVRGPSSGNIALVTILQIEGVLVAIANTHIKWDSPQALPQDQIGLRQMRQLLSHHILPDTSVDYWIICGDMNCEPGGPLLQEVARASFKYPANDQSPTYYAEDKCAQIDFILCQKNLTITALERPCYPLDTALPNQKEPSDHLPVMALIELPSTL